MVDKVDIVVGLALSCTSLIISGIPPTFEQIVGFFINWQGSWSGQVIQYIRVNSGVVATFMEQKTGNEMGEGGSQLIQVSAGQTIDIAVYHTSGTQNIYGSDSLSTRFWGYRVG